MLIGSIWESATTLCMDYNQKLSLFIVHAVKCSQESFIYAEHFLFSLELKLIQYNLNPIKDELFRGCSITDGGEEAPSLKYVTHIPNNDETWHSYTLPKKDQTNIRIT